MPSLYLDSLIDDCSVLAHWYTDESELKEFLVNETLQQNCSTDEDESKGIIVDECSTEDNGSELEGIIVNKCSTEEDKS